MLILTDIDNTLLCFQSAFEGWLRHKGVDFHEGALNTFYDIDSMFDEPVDSQALVNEFFGTRWASQFCALRNCNEPVNQLKEMGYQFIAISACDDADGTLKEARERNIREVFGFDMEVHLTGYAGTKRDLLSSFEPAIWVEDHVSNAELGAELGHTTYLIDHTYNSKAEGNFTRVADWHELVEHLCAEA